MTARARRGEALFHPLDARLNRVVKEKEPEEIGPEEKVVDDKAAEGKGEVGHA
jgi:hypothetical protein